MLFAVSEEDSTLLPKHQHNVWWVLGYREEDKAKLASYPLREEKKECEKQSS